MSNDSWLGSANLDTSDDAQGATRYCNLISGASGEFSATESLVYAPFKAGTLSKLSVYCSTNGFSSSTTVRTRINSANGAQVASITAGATGWFEDATNTDTIADGDLVNLSFAGSGAPHLVNISGIAGVGFSGTDGTFAFVGCTPQQISGTGDVFFGVGGRCQNSATETNVRQRAKAAGIYDDLRIRVASNTRATAATTIVLRQNAADTALTVSITASGTGLFEDSTHSVAVAVDDYLDYRSNSTDGGTIQFNACSMRFASDGQAFDVFGSPGFQTNQAGQYFNPFGLSSLSSNENFVNGTSPAAFEATYLRAFLSLNETAGFSIALRINQVSASNQQISFPASTTGYFEASGTPDTIAAGALVGMFVSTASNILGIGGYHGLTLEGDAPPPTNYADVSQLPMLVLGGVDPPLLVSQLPMLVLGEIIPDLQVSQLPLLVLAEPAPCTTHRCQLWKIERRDGVILGFTSLDEDVTWGALTYLSCPSLNPSASESASAMGSVGNIELEGIIDSEIITEADLYGGLYDDAYIEVWLAPWADTAGARDRYRRLAAGWTGTLSLGETGFRMEVLGPSSRLDQQALVEFYTPGCRWVFGDARCTVDRDALKTTGAVLTAGNRAVLVATIAAPGTPGLQWDGGDLAWTSGSSAGITCEVKSVDFLTGEIVLWSPPPFLPLPGDDFDLLPGCDQLDATCADVYANKVNFGGFPDVPGQDALMDSPNAKY